MMSLHHLGVFARSFGFQLDGLPVFRDKIRTLTLVEVAVIVSEVVFQEGFFDALHMGINPHVFPVDDHVGEIASGSGMAGGVEDPFSTNCQTNNVVENAGKSSVKGFEAEMSWLPTDYQTYTLAYGYTDAELDEFVDEEFAVLRCPIGCFETELATPRI